MRLAVPILFLLSARANAWEGCTDCWPNTSGPCKATNGVCYQMVGGACPAGTTACGEGGSDPAEPCSNTEVEGGTDDGCDGSAPICVAHNGAIMSAPNSEGDHCAVCVNSIAGGGGGDALDWGCDDETPVCVNDVATDIASMVEGTACAVCFNSLESPDACDLDDGCPPSKPVCADEEGGSIDIWTAGSLCVANCVNNMFGEWYDEVDSGCHVDYPYCVTDELDDPGEGQDGTSCSKCTNESCQDDDMCTTHTCDLDEGCSISETVVCGPGTQCNPNTGVCENTCTAKYGRCKKSSECCDTNKCKWWWDGKKYCY